MTTRATILVPRGGAATTKREAGHPAPSQSLRIAPELLAGLAVLALASITLIGPLGVVFFFGSAAATLATQPLFNLRQLVRFSPLLLLPLLAIISTIWSDAPERTMRASLELLMTFVASIVIARNLRPNNMILALFVAYLILALSTLPDVPSVLASKLPLVASLGSKNQVGYVGYLLFALSVAIAVDRIQRIAIRLAAIACLPFALLVAYLAQSGSTTSSIVLNLIVFPPLALLAALRLPVRLALVAVALLLLGVAALYLGDIARAIDQFRTGVLNKDATLTGRTYLWDFAARLSAVRPYLGYGYGAFWRQGNVDAEGLWRWADIFSRSGFNFHNVFVGFRVDVGLVGVVLLATSCVVVGVTALIRQIARPSVALAAMIGLVAVSYARSYVEEGLIAPFSLSTLIWLATGVYAITTAVPSLYDELRGSRGGASARGASRSLGPRRSRSTLFKTGEKL